MVQVELLEEEQAQAARRPARCRAVAPRAVRVVRPDLTRATLSTIKLREIGWAIALGMRTWLFYPRQRLRQRSYDEQGRAEFGEYEYWYCSA